MAITDNQPARRRRWPRRGRARGAARAAVVAAIGCAAAAAVAPAAFGAHTVGGLIGGPWSPGAPGEFNLPFDVAVYEGTDGDPATDKLFVIDRGAHVVQRLDGEGNFELLWGRNVVRSGGVGDLGDAGEVCTVAADCQAPSASTGTGGGEFNVPTGVAVDQATGHVFVHDRDNSRVQEFDLDGGFVRAWGWGVATGAAAFETCFVAAGCRAGIAGGGAGQLGAGQFGRRAGVAVGPDGHVFAADFDNSRIQEFAVPAMAGDPVAFVDEFGTAGSGVDQFGPNSPLRIAVGPDRVVYASDTNGDGRIVRYAAAADSFLDSIEVDPSPDGFPDGLLPGGTNMNSTAGLAITDTGNLLVMRDPTTGESVVQELANPGAVTPPTAEVERHAVGEGFPDSGSTVGPLGLAYQSGTDDMHVAGRPNPFSFSGPTGVFVLADGAGPVGAVSVVAGGESIGATTATVKGSIGANVGVVGYWFEVSVDGVTFETVGRKRYVSGSGEVEVEAQLTGLEPNTNYRFRLRAVKQTAFAESESAVTPDAFFLTDAAPPDAQTLGSTDRTDGSATLRALIDANGSDTTYRFEWGPAGGSFDHRVPVPDANIGDGNTAKLVTQPINGLLADTGYQYRVVASNAAGTDVGDTVEFKTKPTTGPPPELGRAFELVSPADKIGGAGVGEWDLELGQVSATGFAGYERERFAAEGGLGSMLVDGAHAFANDFAFAERVDGQMGWRSHSPLTRPSSTDQFASFLNPHAAAEDLSVLAWRTNNKTAAFFPELAEPGWDQFNLSLLSDWVGRWEMLGPTDLALIPDEALNPDGGQTDGMTWEIAISADGSHALGMPELVNSAADPVGQPAVRGLAGPGDPTHMGWPDLVSGRSVYMADLSAGLVDSFAGTGARELVNVCAGGTTLPSLDGGGVLGEVSCPAPLPGRDAHLVSGLGASIVPGDTRQALDAPLGRAVSADGSRVFFLSPDPLASGVPDGTGSFCSGSGVSTVCPPQLWVRQENPDGSVVVRWVSRAEDGLFGSQAASLTGMVRFEGATPDGDKVFFRTNSPLTADDPNGAKDADGDPVPPPAGGVTTGTASNVSWDLYMFDLPDGAGADPADGQLTRISRGPGGTGDCNSPLGGDASGANAAGALRFAADDGSRVYFACAAPLDGIGVPGSGTVTLPAGTPTTADATNLYVYDTTVGADERWRFVARLPRGTGPGIDSCATTGVHPAAPLNSAGGSGALLGFPPSLASNCARGSSDGAFITLWSRGQLTADDPDGASADVYGYDAVSDELMRITRPQGGVGGTYPCGTTGEAAAVGCYGDGGFDTVDTASRPPLPFLGVATDPLVSGDRVAFFQSRSRLVPEDTDDAYDVYEWRNGVLSLVSVGTESDAFYRGNDRSGLNVFFATFDALSWQDFDVVMDDYTARVDGGIAEPVEPVVCDVLGGGCQAPGPALTVPEVDSTAPGGHNADPQDSAARLVVRRPGRRALARAGRSGVVALRVRSRTARAVRAVARARIRGRVRRVGAGRARLGRRGVGVVRLRLSRPARRVLARRGRLVVVVRVRARGGAADRVRLVLGRRGGRR